MNFCIVYENTKDKIPFVAERNKDILVYFVENLNKINQNKFIYKEHSIDLRLWPNALKGKKIISPKELINHVKEVNQYLPTYINKTFPVTDDCFNQDYLNKLHALWAKWQATEQVDVSKTGLIEYYDDNNLYPYFNDVLFKIGKEEHYFKVNDLIHKLEEQFDLMMCSTTDWINIENPFPKERCTNNVSNFNIAFNHLGRTLLEKWQHWDTQYEYHDENTFNSLHGFVTVTLKRPQTISYSLEYVDWCEKMNFVPSGHHITLGNIPDLENKLTDYRNIMYNNIMNHFKILLED